MLRIVPDILYLIVELIRFNLLKLSVVWFAINLIFHLFYCSAIHLCAFTQNGKGFFLQTPSEFRQFSASAHITVRLACQLDFKDGSRRSLALSASQSDGSQAEVTTP